MNREKNTQQTAGITVMTVEDRAGIRESIANIINGTEGLRCIGAYSTAEEALKALEKTVPDVLLMDIGLPGMSGDDDDKIFQSICAGASGYVLKNAESSELIRAIQEIRNGAPMSASIARRVLSMVRGKKEEAQTTDMNLTPREMDILQLLVEGSSYKSVADKLFISPSTVQSHIKRIYQKLQVHSKSAAVSKALRYKLFR